MKPKDSNLKSCWLDDFWESLQYIFAIDIKFS